MCHSYPNSSVIPAEAGIQTEITIYGRIVTMLITPEMLGGGFNLNSIDNIRMLFQNNSLLSIASLGIPVLFGISLHKAAQLGTAGLRRLSLRDQQDLKMQAIVAVNSVSNAKFSDREITPDMVRDESDARLLETQFEAIKKQRAEFNPEAHADSVNPKRVARIRAQQRKRKKGLF